MLPMYGKTLGDAINNIKRLIKDEYTRKTVTIVYSKDEGKTIIKRRINKDKILNVYYDEILNVIVFYNQVENGTRERYFVPMQIINIY
jgi:hypothetical protein